MRTYVKKLQRNIKTTMIKIEVVLKPEASASTLGAALEVGKAYHDHSTRTVMI